MEFWKNKVAVVTGALHGIGAQIAEDLTRHGMKVIGFEPTQDNVLELFEKSLAWGNTEGQLIPCKCDVSVDEDLAHAFESIVDIYGGVDLLINNAAIGKAGFISTGNIQDFKKIIDVNIYGFMACTRFAIASMLKWNKGGMIVNVNSICGHYNPPFAMPNINVYVASKKMMTLTTEKLQKELEKTHPNIKVCSISPGVVRTELFKKSGVDFLNDDFFEENPHLTPKDVSRVIQIILTLPRSVKVNEILFHALHELY